MSDTDKLATLAKAATPGPWEWDDKEDRIARRGSTWASGTVASGGSVGYENARMIIDPEDAAFIAAASPDVVLKLLAVVGAAKAWAESDECDKFLPNKRREQEILDALAALDDE